MDERQPNAVAPAAPLLGRERVLGRRDVWALLIGGALVVSLYLGMSAREAFHDAEQGDPAAAKAEMLRAVVVVGTVEVLPTKADGRRWDVGAGGLPDPRVTVVNMTQKVRRSTAMVADTLKAEFNAETVGVREGDELYFRVEDVDVQFDDLIGEYRFRVTREMIEEGELELSFAQVKRLTLRFKPSATRPAVRRGETRRTRPRLAGTRSGARRRRARKSRR